LTLAVVRLNLCFLLFSMGILGGGPTLFPGEGTNCCGYSSGSLSSHFLDFFGEGLVNLDLLALSLFSELLFLCLAI
jgi:hypothetical protein